MNDGLQALSVKIDALSQGLEEAQKLLKELAESTQGDPKQSLIHQITELLPQLSLEKLNSVADYVGFLAESGPSGGENQASTHDGGPGGGENQASTHDGGPGGGENQASTHDGGP